MGKKYLIEDMKMNKQLIGDEVILRPITTKGPKEPTVKELLLLLIKRVDRIEIILNEHTKILERHERILERHERILNEHTEILKRHDLILQKHTEIFERNNLH